MVSEFLEDCPDCRNERAIRKHDAVIRRKARADVLREVREAVEALNTTVPVGYTMTPRAMTIGEFRSEVLQAIDKLRDKEKADG